MLTNLMLTYRLEKFEDSWIRKTMGSIYQIFMVKKHPLHLENKKNNLTLYFKVLFIL